MNIPSQAFIFINILVVIVYVSCVITLYKKGFLYGIFKLLSTIGALILAWILAPVLQSLFTFIKLNDTYTQSLIIILNTIIWFIILFILIKIVCLFFAPLLKKVSKIPVLGSVNKIGGILIGIIDATIVILIMSMLLKTPLIKNPQEVKQGTYIKYVDNLTSKGIELIVDNVDLTKIKENVSDFDVDKTRSEIKTWLKQQGIINE